MKILHLIYDHINNPWVGGGGAVRCYEIYRRLVKKGHRITVVSGKYPGSMDYEIDGLNFKFLGIKINYPLSVFSYILYAHRFLRANFNKFDIIVEDFSPWNPIFSHVFDKNRIVLQIQNYLGKEILKKYPIIGLPFYLIERFYPKRFKNIIVLIPQLKERWKINGKVISQGIDFIPEESCFGDYVGYLGRIDIYQKGLDLLLKAFSELKHIKVKVAGDGIDKYRFLKRARGLSNFEYLGKVAGKRKYDFLLKSRFIVIPSRFEGQGIVALEAASFGKPVIVSDIPELKYTVENGFGVSFLRDNVNDFVRKIEYLWDNSEKVIEMGRRGKQYAAQFTWDKISDEYEKYLLEVLEG